MILHAYDDLRSERPLGAKPERAEAVKRSAAKFLLSRRCRKLCRILGADYENVGQKVRLAIKT